MNGVKYIYTSKGSWEVTDGVGAEGTAILSTGEGATKFLRADGDDTSSWQVPTDTVYTHPTGAGNKHIPTGGASGEFLKYSASGTAVWATPSYTTNTDTTYSAGTGLNLSSTTFNVDVGTTASKIIQLDGSAKLPAVDGSLLTNLPAGGASSIDGLSDGYYNSTSLSVGLGSGALSSEDTSGSKKNVAIGRSALSANTTGEKNTATGDSAL
jgi:hypothetical protein